MLQPSPLVKTASVICPLTSKHDKPYLKAGLTSLDRKQFGEIEGRLLEVNKVVEKLDASIRVAAFEFLKPYIVGGTITASKPKSEDDRTGGDADTGSGSSGNLEELLKNYNDLKPSENAKLLSAHWYSMYGSAPFKTKWIDQAAADSGLTIPSSVDMTFRQAKDKGKLLYQPLGKGGLLKPTVVGEQYLKTTFKVKKGTQTPPSDGVVE